MNLLDKLVENYTWLIPAILSLRDRQTVSRKELAELLEISQDLARAILWTLSKLGLLEKSTEPGRYVVKSILREVAENISKNVVGVKRYDKTLRIVLLRGDTYYMIVVRRKRIISRKVERDLVEKIQELLKSRRMSIKEISDEISESTVKICDALRVLEVMGLLKRLRDANTGRVVYLIEQSI